MAVTYIPKRVKINYSDSLFLQRLMDLEATKYQIYSYQVEEEIVRFLL